MSVVMSSISVAQSIAIAQVSTTKVFVRYIMSVLFLRPLWLERCTIAICIYIRVVFVEFLDSEECVYMVSVMV